MACRGCKERQEAIARVRRAMTRREPRTVVKETKFVAKSAMSDLVKTVTKREEDRKR